MISKITRCNNVDLNQYKKQREFGEQLNKRRNKDNYDKAKEIIIFDQSYTYKGYINNHIYMSKFGILYKFDASNLSPMRIAEIISFLLDR